MDEGALDRARERLAEAADGKPQPGDVEAALERARAQVEALAATAAELEAGLPDRVGEAVRDGIRVEARPVSRQLGTKAIAIYLTPAMASESVNHAGRYLAGRALQG